MTFGWDIDEVVRVADEDDWYGNWQNPVEMEKAGQMDIWMLMEDAE